MVVFYCSDWREGGLFVGARYACMSTVCFILAPMGSEVWRMRPFPPENGVDRRSVLVG